MPLDTYLDDPSIPDATKIKGLQSMGYSRPTAEALLRIGSGAKRERLYERFVRNPARQIVGGAVGNVLHPISSISSVPTASELRAGESTSLSPMSQRIAGYVVPEDLSSAGALAGASAGAYIGHPFLGAELGGTVGGLAQGKSAATAAITALPGAVVNWFLPKVVRTFLAEKISQDMSDRASNQIGKAMQALFKRLWIDNPDLKPPTTPNDLEDFYASGTVSPAAQRAGQSLGKFRDMIKTQPAFRQAAAIQAPYKVIDPLTHTPRYGTVQMTLPEAIDYQQALYKKGYNISGGPRGGIWAEPDRDLASQMRQKILASIQSIPRSGQHLAQWYSDLSRDYGVAMLGKDFFEGATGDKGLLEHGKVYSNVADQQRLSHLNSLVGPQETRGYLAKVAPSRQRIAESGAGHMSIHPPGPVPARMGIHLPAAPTGPAAFTPKFPVAAGLVGSQAVSQAVENLVGGGNE